MGRPRLSPAVATIRRRVREAMAEVAAGDLVLVACSGGTASLALAERHLRRVALGQQIERLTDIPRADYAAR